MQKVRHAANLLYGAIDQLGSLRDSGIAIAPTTLPHQHVEQHLGRREILSQAVVKFPGNAPALFILYLHQAAGKAPESSCPFIHHSLEGGGIVTNRLFQHLTVMNIGAGAIPARDFPLVIANRDRSSAKPPIASIATSHAILRLVVLASLHTSVPVRGTSVPVFGMDVLQPAETIGRHQCAGVFIEAVAQIIAGPVRATAKDDVRSGAQDRIQFLILAAERKVYLLQGRGFSVELFGALEYALFQLPIQFFQLLRFAVEFGKDAYFCPHQLGNDRDSNVIDGSALVTLDQVKVSQVHSRDEDDRSLLESGVLSDNFRELEAIKLGHAHVHQNHRDVMLQQLL